MLRDLVDESIDDSVGQERNVALGGILLDRARSLDIEPNNCGCEKASVAKPELRCREEYLPMLWQPSDQTR